VKRSTFPTTSSISEPVFAGSNALLQAGAAPHEHSEELGLAGLAVLLAAAGFVAAYAFYLRNPQLADQLAETFRGMYRVLVNKYYVDELYAALFVRPMNWISEKVLWQAFDVGVIDGLLNGSAERAQELGGWLRRWQSGNARSYGTWVAIGALAILSYFIFG
jgi:NADH-quinone oxidoreductase subunit L